MHDFIEKARKEGRNDGHLYVLGTLVSFLGGQLLGAIPLLTIMLSKGVLDPKVMTNPSLLGISNNSFLCLALLPFIVSFIFLWLFLRFAHHKKFIVSLTAFSSFNWQKLFFAFFLWLIMSGIIDLTSYFMDPSNYEFNAPDDSFWILLLISLILIPIQTSYEELLFRSYLLQGIGMWKPYRIVPFLFTSVAFGLMHIMNPEVGEYGYIVMSHYIGTGLLLGALVMLSDSMEFSLGMHAANNIYSSVMVGFKGSALTTDSLFYCKEMKVDVASTLFSLALMFIYGYIIWKKYKLKPLSKLFSKVEPSKINE